MLSFPKTFLLILECWHCVDIASIRMDTVFYGSVSSSDNDDGEESVWSDQRQTMCEFGFETWAVIWELSLFDDPIELCFIKNSINLWFWFWNLGWKRIMIKIHPVFIVFNPYFKMPFLKSGCSEIPVKEWRSSAQDSWLC